VGSDEVLENFSWGPGKSWKSPGFFVSKRVGTLFMVSLQLVVYVKLSNAEVDGFKMQLLLLSSGSRVAQSVAR